MEYSYNSYAKINWFLELGKKDSNNYHPFYSLVLPISLHDQIKIKVIKDFKGKINLKWNIKEPINKNNTIIKAWNLIKTTYKIEDSIGVTINKKIPLEGGLGGGSSNAAVFINAVDELLNLNLTLKDKLSIGKQIGMDVNFFIESKPAICYGYGEKIKPIKLKDNKFKLLLVKPKFGCNTKMIYSHNKKISGIKKRTITNLETGDMNNDLENCAFTFYPDLKEIKSDLLKNGAINALLSGSGSTVFGVFKMSTNIDFLIAKYESEYEFVKEVLINND